jgi:hypothetical protein
MATNFQVVVYINGYRFDPIHVSASFATNDVCQFQVDVPPVPEWDLLLPRSHGAVFFLDPMTNTYRLMCEGEYVGLARTKVGTGQRTRGLIFRGLHGSFEETTFFNILGGVSVAGQTPDPMSALAAVSARANGNVISQQISGKTFVPVPIATILDQVAKSGNVSSAFIEIPRRLLAQTPVESFYFWARHSDRKMWTFLDTDLKAAMDYQRWSDILKNTVNALGLGMSATLMNVLQRYEETAFYQHIPIPAPPLYKTTAATPTEMSSATPADVTAAASKFYIPELLFAPYLYNIVPPACNTLFNDQLKGVSGTLAFASVPTRYVAQYNTPSAGSSALPLLYMANDQYDVQNISQQSSKLTALQQISHGMFSEDELIRGVHCVTDTVRFEKTLKSGEGLTQPAGRATLPDTLDLIVRHEFNRARGQSRVLQITAVFQPYLVPGFPIIVEDGNQPFRAMVQSVTHSMSCDGQPSTSIVVTHVEELFQLGTGARTAPLPAYLNQIYTPPKIADTYENMFGPNLMEDKYASAVPPNVIQAAISNSDYWTNVVNIVRYTSESRQLNMDLLLSAVVDVPAYSNTGTRLGNISHSGASIASQLRNNKQPHEAMLRYQYRSGCSLQNWMIMHALQTNGAASSDTVDRTPPQNIGNAIKPNGDEIFGHPAWLEPNTNPASLTAYDFTFPQYGAYKAVAKPALLPNPSGEAIISPLRQQLTGSIQAAVQRGATNDTKLASEIPTPVGDFNATSPTTASQT